MFEEAYFIKSDEDFKYEYSERNYAPIFSKRFTLDTLPHTASLAVCALGIGYAYINGSAVSGDLFAPPTAQYQKRLWYMTYDALPFLKKGENIISVICGNGFLNEDFDNAWESKTAPWRDNPKLLCELRGDEKLLLVSDESWKCSTEHSPYVANRLRLGVIYDSRIPEPDSADFDTSDWKNAIRDSAAPSGALTECCCEGIREFEKYPPVNVRKLSERRYLYDFGYNISGYVRIKTHQAAAQTIKISYGEEITEDGELELHKMDTFFDESEFATEYLICSGKSVKFSSKFSYYGFRYVILDGVDVDALESIESVFVHQDVERRTEFECSDPFLNKLFDIGIRATYSNLFYMPTDCPTREKYGWMNDAQSSSEQILTNFCAEKMFERWFVDICDAFDDEKGLPGIVPSHGWGYHWGNGPVSDGSLFEHPYRVYLHSGDPRMLIDGLPYFKRYFKYIATREDANGGLDFGLCDWVNPHGNEVALTPRPFINACLRIKFAKIALLAASLANADPTELESELKNQTEFIKRNYISSDGTCRIEQQTALAMLIYLGVYDTIEPLASQLKTLVEKNGFRHDCGMVGLRYLYSALSKCNWQELAMKIITSDGYPSYRKWIDLGATTLWETWNCNDSHNHQMFSDVLSYMVKTVLGISPDDNAESFERITVAPYFFERLSYAKGSYLSPKGRVNVNWSRTDSGISLFIDAPADNYVIFDGRPLTKGEHNFIF